MSDREHVHPMVLRVLVTYHSTMLGRRWGGPLLTARASAVMAAVEKAMVECTSCEERGQGRCGGCKIPLNLIDGVDDAWGKS